MENQSGDGLGMQLDFRTIDVQMKSFNRMATKDGKEKKRKADEKMER